jgi:hypothetical protein
VRKIVHPSLCYSSNHPTLVRVLDYSEKQVISRQSERLQQLQLGESLEDLKQGVINRMKSVTNAEEDLCIAILEDNKYDLKASLDAFFQS